jgi:hypothetical protein
VQLLLESSQHDSTNLRPVPTAGAGLFYIQKGEHKMTTDHVPKADVRYTESPASWNVRYMTTSGFSCMLTLRSETGLELLEKADAALSFLLEKGYSPCNNNNHLPNDTRWCTIHQCEMRRREKDSKTWYSHRLEDGGWCRGKQQIEGGQS